MLDEYLSGEKTFKDMLVHKKYVHVVEAGLGFERSRLPSITDPVIPGALPEIFFTLLPTS